MDHVCRLQISQLSGLDGIAASRVGEFFWCRIPRRRTRGEAAHKGLRYRSMIELAVPVKSRQRLAAEADTAPAVDPAFKLESFTLYEGLKVIW